MSAERAASAVTYLVESDQPSLSPDEARIVRDFQALYYDRWIKGADTINLSWFGHQVLKCPMDLWIYQELLFRTRPEVVIETGTYNGGSALFMAMMLERIGRGRLISIDVEARPGRPEHPLITYVMASSTDPAVIADVKAEVRSQRAMVILDSDHREEHVFAEIQAYKDLVQVGDYLVVEDTNVNGHPALPDYGPGPMEALNRFLAGSDEFEIDPRCERFLMTLNPRGYLRRVR
jgi:cephalosporin hydroxylase